MSISTFERNASVSEMAAEIDRRGKVIEKLEAEAEQLKAALRDHWTPWSAVDVASPLREQIFNAIRAFSSATTAEADAAAIAILRDINNWFGLGRDPTNPFAPR